MLRRGGVDKVVLIARVHDFLEQKPQWVPPDYDALAARVRRKPNTSKDRAKLLVMAGQLNTCFRPIFSIVSCPFFILLPCLVCVVFCSLFFLLFFGSDFSNLFFMGFCLARELYHTQCFSVAVSRRTFSG